jgi:Holliday junction resolvase
MLDDIENEFLENILPDKQRPRKKKNSKVKGNTGERELVKILTERFPNKIFTRTMGSGNYTGGKNAYHANILDESQKLLFVADIRTPKEFKFSIEHKFYNSIDFYDLFNKSSNLFSWYTQSATDAKLLKKQPLLVVKTNRHKRIAFLPLEVLLNEPSLKDSVVFIHNNHACMWLEDLLKAPDSFFFDESVK